VRNVGYKYFYSGISGNNFVVLYATFEVRNVGYMQYNSFGNSDSVQRDLGIATWEQRLLGIRFKGKVAQD
jgi:hypothetical protein